MITQHTGFYDSAKFFCGFVRTCVFAHRDAYFYLQKPKSFKYRGIKYGESSILHNFFFFNNYLTPILCFFEEIINLSSLNDFLSIFVGFD